MRKLKIAYLLAFAPVLMGADPNDYASSVNGLTVTSALPECGDQEFLTYSAGGLICSALSAGGAGFGGPADCKAQGKVLTYTMSGEIGTWACIDKGMESLSSTDITTINTKYQDLVNMETQIKNLEMGMRTPAAKYCGLSATQTNGGRIDAGGGVFGVPAAAKICEGVTGCGTGARMCSVYDMYQSAATGAITQNTAAFGKAWVYMNSWQNFDSTAEEPTAGLNDNCGGYTYPTSDKKWRGTAVQWATVSTGPKVLKFFTGAGATGAQCNVNLPIACCR